MILKVTFPFFFSLDNVASGRALKLNINFHKRTGNKKEQQVAIISHSW